jgi:hypothetical protein
LIIIRTMINYPNKKQMSNANQRQINNLQMKTIWATIAISLKTTIKMIIRIQTRT